MLNASTFNQSICKVVRLHRGAAAESRRLRIRRPQTGSCGASLTLVAIHAAVGRGEECFIAIAVVRKHRRPGAQHDRDTHVPPDFELNTVHRLLQLESLALGLLAAAT